MAEIELVTMPWDLLRSPSLALGILQPLLRREGMDVGVRSFKLRWMDMALGANAMSLGDYSTIACAGDGLGEWIFAAPPVADAAAVEAHGVVLRERAAALADKLDGLRRLAPRFLDACAEELLARRPKVVGFTTTFAQNMASLLLAHRLKQADPSLRIVFGGANCEGVSGAALQRCFPWIDVVVRGEAEAVAPRLFRELLSGEPLTPAPGLGFFEGTTQVVFGSRGAAPVNMDDVPRPDYDDYFTELATMRFGDTVRSTAFLSFEAARGCWWGEVSHCTFCGLNGASMKFRSKSAARVLDDVLELARRHQILDLHAVDNILDPAYLGDLVPALAARPMDLRLFVEVKANLKREQVELLHRAGVRAIQPGIESLSTPILGLMKKGVTAFQNLRLLKWCQELGITVHWNLIAGIPGEPEEEYARMAELVPALTHLPPPTAGPLAVHRYSPIHERPAAHGVEVLGPAAHLAALYAVNPDSLNDLAYEFEYRHTDGRRPEVYSRPLMGAIAEWRAAHAEGASLELRRGPGFVQIRDRRGAAHVAVFTLEGDEADVVLACHDGARVETVCARTGHDRKRVEAIAAELAAEGLLYREGERLLGLAVTATPRLGATAVRAADAPNDGDDGDIPALPALRVLSGGRGVRSRS